MMSQQNAPLSWNPDPRCEEIIRIHSHQVWQLAQKLALSSQFADAIDYAFLHEACMLHDCGIIWCDAPSIFCFGTEPYMKHGELGAKYLRAIDPRRYARAARVCERHIGAGLTADEIRAENLPLEPKDLLPETFEEKLVCYADNFYSKDLTRLTIKKSFERIAHNMERFGPGPLARLMRLHDMFGE